MNTISIRGAITVEENSETAILEAAKELIQEIENRNSIDKKEVISIIFTCTRDLDSVYPAKAARELNYLNASLMCLNEMYVENSLEKCIRIMILLNSEKEQKDAKHVYLRDAKVLRPDLSNKA